MRTRKCLLTVLVFFTVSGMLFAGGSQSRQSGGTSGLYVIPMLIGSNNTTGGLGTLVKRSDEHKIGQFIKDKFGIVFEYSVYAGDLREKESLMLAAGDYNELQEMQRDDMVLNYIQAGALVDLLPHLNKMPDFQSRFKDTIPYWRLICGGPLYKYETAVPRELDTDVEVWDFFVRTDLLEKAGWPALRSSSDWIRFLERVVPGAVDVNRRPISGVTMLMAESFGLAGIVPILYEKGENYLPLGNEGFIFDYTRDQFVDYFQNANVKESFKFWSDLNRRGLLDPECFTDTADLTMEKVSRGSAAVMFYSGWFIDTVNTALRNAGHPEMEYIRLPIQSDSQVANNEKRLVRVETTRSFDSYGITKNCKDPEKLMALINWTCSDEGQIITRSGIQGAHWTLNAQGKRTWTDLFARAKLDPSVNAKEGIGMMRGLPLFNLPAKDGQPHDLSTQIEWIDGQGLSARQKEAYSKLGWDSSLTWYSKNAKLGRTGVAGTVYIEPASELGSIHTRMTETRLKHSAALILAKTDAEFENVYQTAMAEYNRLNHASVINEFNRQYREKINSLSRYQ
jgi:ABC-type glycerol-3-phosphate transport system substrate-binding protein